MKSLTPYCGHQTGIYVWYSLTQDQDLWICDKCSNKIKREIIEVAVKNSSDDPAVQRFLKEIMLS